MDNELLVFIIFDGKEKKTKLFNIKRLKYLQGFAYDYQTNGGFKLLLPGS